MSVDRVQHRLEQWKRQLIDLTRRNRLLNFKPTSASTVEIVDEVPQQIFAQLLSGASFTFDPLPEEDQEDHDPGEGGGSSDEDRSRDDLRTGRELTHDLGSLPERHRDNRLQTRLGRKRLGKNLLNIYRRAEESLEEQGINTLFLALGMLEWKDMEGSGAVSKAPLLMVPVALTRRTAAEPFRLQLGDEEPFLNLALVEKLRLDFRVELPSLPDLTEELEVDETLKEVRSRVDGFEGWRLTADIALGLFSFQKFVMYRDIENNEGLFQKHELIRGICQEGDQDVVAGVPEEVAAADLDREMAPWTTVQVLDADSSQQRAMLAVRKDHDLVIEGPPGTGKSQTITNIIADSLHAGKTVLFVSEKMAALEVVQSRLEHDAGLASYVLELHSNKASKTEFVKELSASLDRWDDSDGGGAEELQRLQSLTEELDEYVRELHRPDPQLGLSPFQGVAELVQVEDARRVDAPVDEIRKVTSDQLRATLERVRELVRSLEIVGDPRTHPLRGLGLRFSSRAEQDRVCSAVEKAADALAALTDGLDEVTEVLGLRRPSTLGDAHVLVEGARVVASSPGAESSVLDNPRWNELSAEVVELLEAGASYVSAWAVLEERLTEDVLEADLTAALGEYEELLHRGAIRWLLPGYWRIRSKLRSFLREGYRPDARALASDIQTAGSCRTNLHTIREADRLGRELFGARWGGPESDWDDLEEFATWVTEYRGYVLKELLAEKGLELAQRGEADAAAAERLTSQCEASMNRLRQAAKGLVEAGKFDEQSGLHPSPEARIAALGRRIAEVEGALDDMRDFSAFVGALAECREGPAGPFVQAALAEAVPASQLIEAFRRRFFELWCGSVLEERPVLNRFRTQMHERKVEEFRERDMDSLEIAQRRTRSALENRRQELLSSEYRSQLQLLQREARKRRRILPIRKLIRATPDAIQRVKPCFMMSPLSVAQFLDAEAIHFDLLVFDEASQIPPADAIGAIVRADQTVVVGDSKQLPPTNFFGVHLDDAETPEEEELALLTDLESILDEVAVSGVPRIRLKWHYRSQHESLIRFSNEEFYHDDPLYVFPAAEGDGSTLGLQFELVEDGVYEGKGRNSEEARRVADAVVEHVHEFPRLSLGVGTFGIAQQSTILDEIDQRRREDPEIEWFFHQEGEKKFFVKNLENIQGDDRDVIFLSVTYGPDANGVLRRNFGPINKQGGWRRLNVLTTRAKRRLKIFSSMRGDQIDVEGIAEGAALLRQYLQFAETGEYPSSNLSLGPPESPFERAVIRALESEGYRIVPQVGDSGYRIDIGVLDPNNAGRYVCGIECDGASYHSAATVRDRDRLRQQVLEMRGWDIHRVWSTDWFHSPRQQIDRLVKLIEESQKRGSDKVHLDLEVAPPSRPSREDEDPPRQEGPLGGDADRTPLEEIDVAPYRFFEPVELYDSEAFYATPIRRIADVARDVIEAEGPVHVKDIARRAIGVWGMKQAGKRIRKRIEEACRRLANTEEVEWDGDFYWRPGLDPIPVRDRSLDGVAFDPELIAPCEIMEGMRLVLRHRAPLLPEDLIVETARILGFARTGSRLRSRIESAKELLIEKGEVRVGGTGLYLNE